MRAAAGAARTTVNDAQVRELAAQLVSEAEAHREWVRLAPLPPDGSSYLFLFQLSQVVRLWNWGVGLSQVGLLSPARGQEGYRRGEPKRGHGMILKPWDGLEVRPGLRGR